MVNRLPNLGVCSLLACVLGCCATCSRGRSSGAADLFGRARQLQPAGRFRGRRDRYDHEFHHAARLHRWHRRPHSRGGARSSHRRRLLRYDPIRRQLLLRGANQAISARGSRARAARTSQPIASVRMSRAIWCSSRPLRVSWPNRRWRPRMGAGISRRRLNTWRPRRISRL